MIELLILYLLLHKEYTMYGISKEIDNKFGVYTKPSFGALNPTLRRLEQENCITSRKSMSEGGRLSIYYTITKAGEKELKSLIKKELSVNPIQFISNAKIKLSVADVLDSEERKELFLHIKTLALSFKQAAEKILNDEYTEKNFYQRILLDNSSVEFSNLVTIVEGFEKDNARNS